MRHWRIWKLFTTPYGRVNEEIICIHLPKIPCLQHWLQVKNKECDLRGVDMSKQILEVYLRTKFSGTLFRSVNSFV